MWNEIDVDVERLVQRYMAAWSEPNAARRRMLLEDVWDEGGVYADPMSLAEGREELHALIGGFLAQNPGATFELLDQIDFHHAFVRFRWRLTFGSGDVMDGMDFGGVLPEGRLGMIVGFFS